jgi:restriction endonuclease S subunit
MYLSSNSARIDDTIEHARYVEELSTKKMKLEKKYFTLLDDVKNFANEFEKMVVQKKINADVWEEDEMEAPENKGEGMEDERDAMKEEKKKLAYMF